MRGWAGECGALRDRASPVRGCEQPESGQVAFAARRGEGRGLAQRGLRACQSRGCKERGQGMRLRGSGSAFLPNRAVLMVFWAVTSCVSDAGPEAETGIVLSRLVKQITRPRVGQVKRASTFHQRKSINLYLVIFNDACISHVVKAVKMLKEFFGFFGFVHLELQC